MSEPPVPPFHDAPPIPPSSGDLCPVCHATLPGRPRLCPNCGAVLAQSSGGTSCWTSFLSVTLVLLALGCGGAGACFLQFASLVGAPTDAGGTGVIYAIAAICFGAALACGWAVFDLNRRKK